jgi:hypothetical protein
LADTADRPSNSLIQRYASPLQQPSQLPDAPQGLDRVLCAIVGYLLKAPLKG